MYERETLAILEKISKNTSDSRIVFMDREIDNFCTILLAQSLKTNSSIKKLSFCNNRVGYLGIKELTSALETNKTIKIVEFDKITIHYASALELGKVLQFNSITVFVLSSCNLNNLSLCKLAEALNGNTSLKSLDLYNNKFSATGLKALFKALENNTTLEELNLKENYLGDSGGRVIADGLGLNKTSIKTLDIGYCFIGNAGARALTEALKGNKSLIKLMLDNNKYSYDSLSSLLEALTVNRTLKCLYANYFTVFDDDNYMSNSKSNHITLVLLLCEILRLNPTFEKMFLPHIEFSDNQMLLLLDAIKKHKHIEDFYYTSKNLNSIFSGKIVSILEKNKIIKSIRSKLRQNSFVLEILPEEMWELICDFLPNDGLVNFNLSLSLEY